MAAFLVSLHIAPHAEILATALVIAFERLLPRV